MILSSCFDGIHRHQHDPAMAIGRRGRGAHGASAHRHTTAPFAQEVQSIQMAHGAIRPYDKRYASVCAEVSLNHFFPTALEVAQAHIEREARGPVPSRTMP